MILSNGLGLDEWAGAERKNIMKNKVFEAMRNLQLFAEGEGAGAGGKPHRGSEW